MKKKALLLSLGLILPISVAAVALIVKGNEQMIGADPEQFTITINAEDITTSETFEDMDYVAHTDQLNNPVTFRLEQVKRNGDYLEFKGENDGFIGNKTTNEIYAMKSVDIYFKEDNPAGTTKVQWGWKNEGVVTYPYSSNIYSVNPDGYLFRFDDDNPDFFQIVNDDVEDNSLFIKKLVITYGDECKTKTSYGDPYTVINKIKYKKLGDHWCVLNAENSVTDLVFESEIGGLPVTEVADYAFYIKGDVETVVFTGSNITKVGDYAFYRCSGLTSVDFRSSNVTHLGSYCFTSCNNLTDVKGLDLIEVFEDSSMSGVPITSITLSDNLRELDGSPFFHCDDLASVTFSDLCEPTYISNGAFNWCVGLESVHIGSLMEQVPGFYMCPIKAFTIGADPVKYRVDASGVLFCHNYGESYYLQKIPMGTELTSYTVPSYVSSIAADAAEGCSALQTITINAACYSIGSEAFCGCTGLTTVNFASGSTLRYINNEAFDGCTNLATIALPSCVTNIGFNAFRNCTSLTSFTIPHDISSIGCAFAGCSNIATLYYDGTVEDWNTRSIYKYSEWYEGVSATVLTCSDNTIDLADAD